MLESQKYDKHIIKHLDLELNNTLLNLKKLLTIQNEWTRLEDILMAEQKWLDEIGLSLPDLTKTTSNNYIQTLSNTQVNKTKRISVHFPLLRFILKKKCCLIYIIYCYYIFVYFKFIFNVLMFTCLQNTIAEVTIHYDTLIFLKDVIEKLQDEIDVKPLLYICEQHTNDSFKLKNNLKTKEIRLIAFNEKFNGYNNLKNNVKTNLLLIKSNLESLTPNRETINNYVRNNNVLS